MYKIRKTFEVAGSHKLDLNYESKCQNQHGHNWLITVEISSAYLDQNGMVIDFVKLKDMFQSRVHSVLDHKHLNEVVDFNPTAENLAHWVLDAINQELTIGGYTPIRCTRVIVQESNNNEAEYSL